MTMRELQSVEVRLSRIERVHRALLAVAISLALLVVFGAFRWGAPKVVGAERFELVDSAGLARATLETTEDGEVGLFVLDDSSRVRISVTHAAEETALFIKNAAGDTRVGVAQFSHGGGGFALHGEEMKGAAVLYLQNQSGSLRIFDREGEVTYRVP